MGREADDVEALGFQGRTVDTNDVSLLFGPSQTTPAMEEAVSDVAWLRAMLRFEAELAIAQAKLGWIPEEAARAIAHSCATHSFDIAVIGRAAIASATPVVPLLEALRETLPDDVRPNLHRGATSQDVIDTAMMLIARDGIGVLLADLTRLGDRCVELGAAHRTTPIAARTLLQQAVPTTFGLKAANWLMGLVASRRLLIDLRDRRLALQLGGAAGTLAAFGGGALELSSLLAARLDLVDPPLPWHSERSRVIQLAMTLSVTAVAAGKISRDLVLMAQTEVGEVSFGNPGKSSAMPHKRNPAAAVEAEACVRSAAGPVAVLLQSAQGEHERAAGAWQAEWQAVTDAFRFTAGAVGHTLRALTDARLDTERMRKNLFLGPGEDGSPSAAGELIDRALAAYRGDSR